MTTPTSSDGGKRVSRGGGGGGGGGSARGGVGHGSWRRWVQEAGRNGRGLRCPGVRVCWLSSF